MPTWIWFAIGFLAIVGPIMWLMPSALEKKQLLLRNKAIQLGMRNKLEKIMLPYEVTGGRDQEIDTISYNIFSTDNQTISPDYQGIYLYVKAGEWFSPDHKKPSSALLDMLNDSPVTLQAIKLGAERISLYWDERGSPEDVESLYKFAVSLKNALI